MKSLKFIVITSVIVLINFVILFFVLKYVVDKERDHLTIYGNVDIRQVDLGFRVFGRVQQLIYDEGDEIAAGQLMAVLDKVPYEEKVAAAKAKVLELEFLLKNMSAKYEKRDKVVSGAISKEDLDDSYYNLEETRASLEGAKANLATALTNLQDTDIFCPTKGTILTRIREPGSIVDVGFPVYTLSIASPVWIRAYVSETHLGDVYFDMPAEIYTDTKYTTKVFRGHIGFISPVAEFTPKNVESTDLRTDLVYRLRVIVDDPDHELKQGMPVTVKLKMK